MIEGPQAGWVRPSRSGRWPVSEIDHERFGNRTNDENRPRLSPTAITAFRMACSPAMSRRDHAIERINQLPDAPVVVALTTFDADQYVLRALRAGAAGFLVKSTPPEDLIRLVRVAADRQSNRQRARGLVESLTERELEVLACLGEGLSNAQIAERLYLSEATVKGYVSRMLDKLGCANRTQVGLLAHDAGIVGRKSRFPTI
jgi:DNA-binding NarL/FixJ family response regulator